MNGLERVDAPRRWPWVVGVLIVAVLVAAGVWLRLGRSATPPGEASSCMPAPETETASTSCALQAAIPEETTPGGVSSNEPVPVPESSWQAPASPQGASSPEPATTPAAALQSAPLQTATTLAAEADTLLAAGRKDKAREQYLAALSAQPDAPLRAQLEAKLGPLNVELIRLPWPMAEKQDVVVQEGDSIKAIARKYGTTVELVIKGNQLKRPDIIIPGKHLKVFAGKMEITVSKARNDLLLTANGRFFKRYGVGTGRYDKTPVGSFVISERIPEPPWWREDGKTIPFGDKENILGSRWMAIKATGNTPEIKGYGIHGTWDDASIGKAESAGCIRLRNVDVEELFELVPVGTPVVIGE